MKKLFGLVFALVAFTGAYAQCNLEIINTTGVNIELYAIEATGYDCTAYADNIPGIVVLANSSTTVSHVSQAHWVGIHLSEIGGSAVSEAFPNDLATNCTAGSGTVTVTWNSACQVVIS